MLVGVSQYIHLSVYRNPQRMYIVSQYKIRIAIYREFLCPPLKKEGHIALHMSVGMSVGRYVGSP